MKTELCSAGRITAFLVALRVAGYLAIGSAEDRRTRNLIPIEALLATHRDRWKVMFDLLAELRPSAKAHNKNDTASTTRRNGCHGISCR